MDLVKLRIKLGGDPEFEAEGSEEYVEKQRDLFSQKLGSHESKKKDEHHTPAAKPLAVDSDRTASTEGQAPGAPQNLPLSTEAMVKIANVNDDVVTLTLLPGGDNPEGDSLLLLLLGHKVLRNEDLIQADQLLKGMSQSGFPHVDRLDRITSKIDSSCVGSIGNRRGKKYRLLNPGITKAKEVAEKLIKTVS
jgi:hypothetical protein